MTPVKTIQKYKCDFCKKRSTKSVIALHEKRCFRNPNRFCDYCKNTGKEFLTENDQTFEVDCHFCERFDADLLKQIKEREAKK